MTKLLWIVHDMAETKLLLGGLDKLVDITLKHKNFALSYKLADILLTTEGGRIVEKSFCKLLKLAVKTEAKEDILSCAKISQRLGPGLNLMVALSNSTGTDFEDMLLSYGHLFEAVSHVHF